MISLRHRLEFETLEGRIVPADLIAGFSERLIAGNLVSPTSMSLAPDGRIFVAEQYGNVRVIKDGELLPEPFVSVAVDPRGERGLSGILVEPDLDANPFVYLYYTVRGEGGRPSFNRISRFTIDGDQAAPGSEVVLMQLDGLSQSFPIHNGGAMHFGPDGKLYVAVGDGAEANNAQTLNNVLGKMLRINRDGSIPRDNPFFDRTNGQNRAIWALGLRNPFTFAFSPTNGTMFINDVGGDRFEEINLGRPGANYGWPEAEGFAGKPGFQTPLLAIPHNDSAEGGFAITGGAFYEPEVRQFPDEYMGKYFFGDFGLGRIRVYDASTGLAPIFASGVPAPVDLRVAPDGSLFYLGRGFGLDTGVLYRVTYDPALAPQIVDDPAATLVSVGQTALFSASADGTQPIRYQWQRDGEDLPGENAEALSVAGVSMADDGARFRVVVSNEFGSVTSAEAVLSVTTDLPPVPEIELDSPGLLFVAGEEVVFRGRAVDPETGELPASALTWRIDYITAGLERPFVPAFSGVAEGAFTPEQQTPFLRTDVSYRITLSATDPMGLIGTATLDVLPRLATFTVESDLPNTLWIDGEAIPKGRTVEGVAGVFRQVEAAPFTVVGGERFLFRGWSDGFESVVRRIATPAEAASFRAEYEPGRLGGQDEARVFAFGPGKGGGPLVVGLNPDGTTAFGLAAFDPAFSGGVRTAVADVTGDGVPELIAATGPGVPAQVRIFDGRDGRLLRTIDAFEPGFTGGAFVAAGDVTGDGIADLVITPDEGGGGRVRIFELVNFRQIADFFAIDDPNFRGGARAALGDMNGDRIADLLVSAGFGGGPRIAGFDGATLRTRPTKLFDDFFAFESSLRNGAFVALGDIDGDGYLDPIFGAGPGGGPRVLALSGRDLTRGGVQVSVANFFAGPAEQRGGVRVTAKDLDGDRFADLITGSGEGSPPMLITFLGKDIPTEGLPPVAAQRFAFNEDFVGGVFVG